MGGGSGPSTIEKDGPQDFTKNAIKSVPQGGGGLGRSSKIYVSHYTIFDCCILVRYDVSNKEVSCISRL